MINFLRTLVQMIAFAIFVYQMQHSIKQYVEKPIVQVSSTTSIDNIKMPIIYVCQNDQYDYTVSNFYGYEWMSHFFGGQLSGTTKISWRGKHNNMTFRKIFSKIFPFDNESFNAKTYNYEESENYEWKKFIAEMVGKNPYGLCMKLEQSKGSTYFSMKKRSIFQIVDPQADNFVVISHMENGYGEFGPTANGSYDYYSYMMDISLHDSSLLVGQSCANYVDSGYRDCTYGIVEEKFLKWYGCLPPWFTTNVSKLCDDTKEIMLTKQLRKEMMEELNMLATGQELKSFESCLPPCLTISVKLKQLKHVTNNPKVAGVRINVNKKTIKVYTLAHAYDAFNLVVDLGSALGLWFGLSAISIYDTIMEFIVTSFKKKCNLNRE